MLWFTNAFMCLNNFQGPKGIGSSGQPRPASGFPHPAHSPGSQVRALGPAGPAPVTPQQQGWSPAPHSPAMPCHRHRSEPSLCLSRAGAAPIPPSCPAPGWGSGTVLDATSCLDMLKEPLLGKHPAPGHCQPLSCPAALSLDWWLSSSTPQEKPPGMSLVKFQRSPRCSNVTWCEAICSKGCQVNERQTSKSHGLSVGSLTRTPNSTTISHKIGELYYSVEIWERQLLWGCMGTFYSMVSELAPDFLPPAQKNVGQPYVWLHNVPTYLTWVFSVFFPSYALENVDSARTLRSMKLDLCLYWITKKDDFKI